MSTRRITIAVLLVVTAVFAQLSNRPLSGGPERIVALELAPSVERADEFLTTWQRSDREHWQEKLLQSLDWDTWLILSYAPLFALLCWSAARALPASHPRLRAWGIALAAGQLLAGALDFVENFGMRQMILAEAARPPWPLITSTSSGIKWLLILVFVAFGIGVLAHKLRSVAFEARYFLHARQFLAGRWIFLRALSTQIRGRWSSAVMLVEGWVRLLVLVALVNVFHLATIYALHALTGFPQAQDAVRALASRPNGSWFPQLFWPAVGASSLICLSAGLLAVATRGRVIALAVSHQLNGRVALIVAGIVAPASVAIYAGLAAVEWAPATRTAVLIAGLVIGIAVSASLAAGTIFCSLGHVAGPRPDHRDNHWSWRIGPSRIALSVSVSAFIIIVVGVTAMLSRADTARSIGPLGISLLGFTAWSVMLSQILVGVPMFIRSMSLRLAWFAALIFLGTRLVDPYRMPTQSAELESIPSTLKQRYDDTEDAFYQWLRTRADTDGSGPIPVILVAADGGGIRAAYWTARSLANMNATTKGEFAKFTFAYSGVSGGSLGIATFIDGVQTLQLAPSEVLKKLDAFYAQDFTSPVLGWALTLDPLRYYANLPGIRGRDSVFEETLDRDWHALTGSTSFGAPMLNVLGPGNRALRWPPPVVVFNATVAETGKRLEIANIKQIETGTRASAYYGFNWLVNAPSLTLAQAVHLSARFPGFSPPASVYADVCPGSIASAEAGTCKRIVRRWITVVDGGYNDNSGIGPILGLLNVLTKARREATVRVQERASDIGKQIDVTEQALREQLLARVSFHVVLSISNPVLPTDPVERPTLSEAPLLDLAAAAGAIEHAREGRANDSALLLRRLIMGLRDEARVSKKKSLCLGGDVRPSVVPTRRMAQAGDCQRLGDTLFLQQIASTQDLAERASERRGANARKIVSSCGKLSHLDELPLAWSLSPASHEALRCATEYSTGKFSPFENLAEFWRDLNHSR